MIASALRTIMVLLALLWPLPTLAAMEDDSARIWDRLEILNHVQSFSHFLDERDFDQWQSLFTDDIRFEAFPGDGSRLEIQGKPALLSFFQHRYQKGGLSEGQRRHALSTIRVYEQTADSARVKLYVTISMATDRSELAFVTTGTYDIGLVKTPAGWKAASWQIKSDVKATPPIEIPTGAQDQIRVDPEADKP